MVRGPASDELLSALVTAIGDKINYLPDTGELADYLLDVYEGAEGRQRDRLWRIMSGHGQSLVSFAMDAQAQGDTSRVDQAAAALVQLNHAAAVDGIMALRQQVDYPQDYFMGYVRALTQAHNNPAILQRLGDYLQDPAADLQSRLIAAEGLLAVKQSLQAKYILDKLVNSNEYTDAEVAAYINGRL